MFAALSTVSQRAAEALTGQRSDLVTIALALVLALGFTPLRRRIQPVVDQVLPARGLLTLLFTDIVGSTERIVALGDERWRAVLESYRAAVRRELARFGGREVDTAGDGFFATFERPTQAVRCAIALRDSLRDLGLGSRVGLHTGECELRGERVSGLSVVVAARIMAAAKANEIITSSALRDVLDGSRFRFRDRGTESLKGVPGEWRLSFIDEGLAAS
jgi:class 3 adenylate cyclase